MSAPLPQAAGGPPLGSRWQQDGPGGHPKASFHSATRVVGTRTASVPAVRLSIVLNAARGDAPDGATRFREAYRDRAVELHVDICHGPDLIRAARAAVERGSTHVAAGGGDGTISSVASVLAGTSAILGVIPLGTLNHFARDLQVPLDVNEAMNAI